MLKSNDDKYDCARELQDIIWTGLTTNALSRLKCLAKALNVERSEDFLSIREKQVFCAKLKRAFNKAILRLKGTIEFEDNSYEASVFTTAALGLWKSDKTVGERRRNTMRTLGIHTSERKWRDEFEFAFCLTLVEAMFKPNPDEPAEVS
jgi:hypothetical protein